jgi:hypothetical protein
VNGIDTPRTLASFYVSARASVPLLTMHRSLSYLERDLYLPSHRAGRHRKQLRGWRAAAILRAATDAADEAFAVCFLAPRRT